MADLLTLQQIAELKEAFAIFDQDGDGSVTVTDLADIFSSVGQTIGQEDLKKMIAEADMDINGAVDFPEFLSLVAQRMHDDSHRDVELRATFERYDLQKTGYLTVSNLKYVMESLGCRLTYEEADEMLREADMDGDGKLSFEEYRRVMLTGDF